MPNSVCNSLELSLVENGETRPQTPPLVLAQVYYASVMRIMELPNARSRASYVLLYQKILAAITKKSEANGLASLFAKLEFVLQQYDFVFVLSLHRALAVGIVPELVTNPLSSDDSRRFSSSQRNLRSSVLVSLCPSFIKRLIFTYIRLPFFQQYI